MGGVIFPYTVNAEAGFAEKVAFFCRVLTLIFLGIFILFLAFGKFIFTPLLGPDFVLVYKGMLGTFPGIFCFAINLIIISYFEGKNKQGVVLWSVVVSLLLLVIADYFLVPKYGFMAAAIVFSVANFCGMAVLLVSFIRTTKITLQNIFLFKPADQFIFRFWKR
jgi:O-antigen/teichoic acid export membrane protein